ncbi:MAG: DUF4126 domain-containing protein, partial [Flavobacteriaceae bacterium]|nr:DUF4126 domain-containing protein [Flavobacteriaceae bacterium]
NVYSYFPIFIMMMSETLIAAILGIGLAASSGFRFFIPLLVLSASAYFGMWELNESWQWLGTPAALIVFGVAVIVEIFGYYIPFIDNLLDTIAIPLATLAGTVIMVSTLAELDPVVTWALAIIAGGGTAAAIKTGFGAARATSSVSTAGIGNPVISTAETGISFAMSILSIFLPVIALIVIIIILIFLFRFYRKIKRPRV